MRDKTNAHNLKMVQHTALVDRVTNYKLLECPKSSLNRNNRKISVRNVQLGSLPYGSVVIGSKLVIIVYWYRETILFLSTFQHAYA